MKPTPGQNATRPGVTGRENQRERSLQLDNLAHLTGDLMLERIVYEGAEAIDFDHIREVAHYMIGLVVGEERFTYCVRMKLCLATPTQSHSLPNLEGYTTRKLRVLAEKITKYLGFPCCQDELLASILNKLDEAHRVVTST